MVCKIFPRGMGASLSSCGTDSGVVVCGLSSPEACGILEPDLGSNPRLLHWKADFFYPWTTGEVPRPQLFFCLLV